MLNPSWHKIFQDLWGNKTRTLLVVLSIAVGVFAVGTILIAQTVLTRDMAAGYAAIQPASAILLTTPFDEDFVQTVRHMPEVSEAEGRYHLTARLQVGPDEWQDLQLYAFPDYADIRLNKIYPQQGAWPPPKHELLIERTWLEQLPARIGENIIIKTADGRTRTLRLAGTVHDLYQPPAFMDGTACGYISLDTLEWLGEPRALNELYIRTSGDALSKPIIARLTDRVEDKVEKSGRTVLSTSLPEPGQHPLSYIIDTIILLLGALGLMALLLSGFLVINTIAALLTQQTRQIGVMKAIGGRTTHILRLYLVMVLMYGLLALIIAMPLGVLGAQAFTQFVAGTLNFNIARLDVPLPALIVQTLVALLAPFLAAIYPVISGTWITVHAALNNYGVGRGRYGKSLIERLASHLPNLPATLLLSLGNTLRRRGRLILTLSTLTLGIAIFIAVFSVRASLLVTLNDALNFLGYDVLMTFSRPYRANQIETEAYRVPGVTAAESWNFAYALRKRPDGTWSNPLHFFAIPANSELMQPVVVEGRWLLPEDGNAVVVNTAILREEPGLKVGSDMVLKVEGRESTWRVVGAARGITLMLYANYAAFADEMHMPGRARMLAIGTAQHDAATQLQVTQALEEHFDHAASPQVSSMLKMTEERANIEGAFDIVVVLLMLMAALMAVVGGFGLTGTMSINVLERTREIGVMRACGASDGTILKVILLEGVLIGLISWLLGTLLAWPLSSLLSDAVGISFLQAPLTRVFALDGVLFGLIGVTALAIVASALPARRAAQLTVREVLAYE